VYCKRNRGFEMQEVKVRAVSEGRAILSGLPLHSRRIVNPEKKAAGASKSGGSTNPSLGPGSH